MFLALNHYYDGVIFHRIINGFMCQGGDPTGTGRGGPGYKFNDELPRAGEYQIGSVAMANAGPNTNGSQFFIVSGRDGVGLPPAYSLFGQVVKGLDVVDQMQRVPTGGGDRPKDRRRHQRRSPSPKPIDRPMLLSGRTAIVTGAGRGIGAAIARALDGGRCSGGARRPLAR